MIQIRGLSIFHKKDLRQLVKDLDLTLNRGDKAALIGEEGNGKSTVIKWIYDNELIFPYAEYEGDVVNSGEKICYLPQEMTEADRQITVYEFFTAGSDAPDEREVSEVMRTVGLSYDTYYSDQKVETLSGGEKIKISMARILLSHPTALLLDEPSNDLDLDTLIWLEGFINAFDGIVLYISHDEVLLENTANRIILLEQLKKKMEPRATVYNLGYQEFKKTREDLFKRDLSIAENQRREFKEKMERFRRIQEKVNHDLNSVSRQDPSTGRLLKKKMKSVKAQEKRFEKEEKQLKEIPEQEESIFFRFSEEAVIPNGKTVLDLDMPKLKVGDRVLSENLRLLVRGPEKVCIIGKNGIGKTTFLKAIADELLKRKDLKAAYMPQNYEDMMDFSLIPVDYLCRTGDREERTRVRTYLGSMKYTADEMLHPISELSGGQKAKIFLLKMNLEGSDVLILDEPTRNFSPLSSGVIRDLLIEFGGAVISISHDRKYIREVCDSVYELTEGGLILKDMINL